jgi:thioredoxin reductase/ferredoxin
MTLWVPLALVALSLVMALLSRSRAGAVAKRVAAPRRPAGLRLLVHNINPDRCTGCEACKTICPTDVLGMVDHKSNVLHFDRCIQCKQCLKVCPTKALVMHYEGTEPPTITLPELDPFFQTAVPGQYLIGEVASKPLVKNAANLGRAVVEHMVAKGGLRPGRGGGASRSDPFDVAIVGSGPGGLSAALTCQLRGLSYVVLEKDASIASTVSRYPKGKRFLAEPYDCKNLSLLPVFDAAKEDLIRTWQAIVDGTRMNMRFSRAVETLRRGDDGVFEIKTASEACYARRVVLATGTRGKPRSLGVEGEDLPKVAYILEDPEQQRDRSVLVVGGGDSALEAAVALAEEGAKKVVLSYRGKSFGRAKKKNKDNLDRLSAAGRLEVLLGSQIKQITDRHVVIVTAEGREILNDAVYVLIGSDPPVKWLEELGVRFVERPHTHKSGATDAIVESILGTTQQGPANLEACLARLGLARLPIARPVDDFDDEPTRVDLPRLPTRATGSRR